MRWDTSQGTLSKDDFLKAFTKVALPLLNPWPLPHSIVIMDNAKMLMCQELEEIVSKAGALLFFLPPYSPQLSPIEFGFGLLKRWIQKHANLAFPHAPKQVLDIAFRKCLDKETHTPLKMFIQCGYEVGQLKETMFLK